jgi:hypothetical protein
MKTPDLLLATCLLLVGCSDESKTTSSDSDSKPMYDYPTVLVDLEHHQTEREDGTEPKQYSIRPSEGLILDTSSYAPELAPQFEGMKCNSIQLVMGNDRQYSAAFDPSETRHVLDASTLKPNPGSQAFGGIGQGDRCIVAVGHMKNEAGKPPAFSVAWVSMADTNENR